MPDIKSYILLLLSMTVVMAQSLEPRLYSNAPIGMNFVVAAYAFSNGTLPDNPVIDLNDAELDVHTGIFAYARVFELFGQSGKADIIIPASCIDGFGTYQGEHVTREVCGVGDIKGRISLNIFGAPALSLKEFSTYKQDLIIGVSLQVTAPTGKYEDTKLVNIGSNRWALKPSLGVSKTVDRMTMEFSAAVEFYSDNDAFLDHIKREQDPIYSTQAHLIYNFPSGWWLGLDANYYWGGETAKDGVKSDDKIEDSRLGATLAIPVNKKYSIKLYGSSGISTRTGTDFDIIGVAWQYRFGAGL